MGIHKNRLEEGIPATYPSYLFLRYALVYQVVLRCTPLATSFRNMFYPYHKAMKHLPTNIILSILNTYFVLKCAARISKIDLQIKILYPKIISINRDFA